MDLYGNQTTIETSTKPNNYYYDFLKKALPFIVPLSLISLLLSYNFHFLALLFTLLTHALERKYMFLICNGILAFLAKTLNFTSSFAITADLEFPSLPFNTQSSDTDPDSQSDETTSDDTECTCPSSDVDKPLDDLELQHEEDKQEEDEVESLLETKEVVGGDHYRDEEENDMNIDTDELNRKVEEFIRKMKEEIRIEARQQLIAV